MSNKRKFDMEGNIDSFKTEVSEYTSIDNRIKDLTERIKPLTTEIKNLKTQKTNLKKNICEFMEHNNLNKCELREHSKVLTYSKRKTAIPVTKDTIKTELQKYFRTHDIRQFNSLSPDEKAESIHKFIYEDREYRYTNVLQTKQAR